MIQQKTPSIPFTVWIIGLVALLINLSSIMIYSLSPLYLTHVFGLSVLYLGILEGFIEFTAWSTRIFSGIISDYLFKRKPILIIAYVLTLLTRPIFALGTSITWIYTAKIIDRFSNGIQAAPREALVGDVSPKEIQGACYGLRQSLSVIGSVLGGFAVMILMDTTEQNYQIIFLISSLPVLLALMALILLVNESKANPLHLNSENLPKRNSFYLQIKKTYQLKKPFWMLIFVSGIFVLSNYGSTYRIIQAERSGFSTSYIALVMIVQNIGVMLASFPVGKFSDRFDRRFLLGLGFAITILSNIIWCFQSSHINVLIASTLWGVQMGITQSLMAAMISDTVEKELRGTAFGIYYFVIGVSLFFANSLTGWLLEFHGPQTAFIGSAAIATLAICLLPILPNNLKSSPSSVFCLG